MFVPGSSHKFNTVAIFDHAEKGDVFEIDSGMGGSFTVIYDGIAQCGGYKFHCPAHNDWPADNYTFSRDQVLLEVYIIIPDNPVFREWNSAVTIVHGKHYLVDRCYGVVWVEDPEGYMKLFRRKWSLASKDEAEAARWRTRIERKRQRIN